MRIQHNIMAMSAYRNYTNNVSAMKKNLEKLSSGYKINRAGDDAAGLAISEKMRAQITGLETAQKNAKDGISLVQTAEGALTEVHDMLNRMVQLATQSANGTYDNDVDRVQMQKEINQLRSEIDRIADSSNFNGIKLLDGSMGMNTDAFELIGYTKAVEGAAIANGTTIASTTAADPTEALRGTNTFVHESGEKAQKGSFTLDLSQVFAKVASASNANSIAVKINGTTAAKITKTEIADLATKDKEITAKQIAAALNNKEFYVNTTGAIATTGTAAVGSVRYKATANSATGEVTFTADAVVTATAGTFVTIDANNTQLAKAHDSAVGPTNWSVSLVPTATNVEVGNGVDNTQNVATTNITPTVKPTVTQLASTILSIDMSQVKDGTQLTIGKETYTFAVGKNSAYDPTSDSKIIDLTAFEEDDIAAATGEDAKKIMAAITRAASGNAEFSVGNNGGTYGDLTIFERAKADSTTNESAITDEDILKKLEDKDTFAELFSIKGPDTPVGTELKITDAKIKEGDVLSIDGKKFVFTDKAENVPKGAIQVKLTGGATTNLTAALGNEGYGTTTSADGNLVILGKAGKAATVLGNGLTLQIGDTADDFNQLNVEIKDTHCESLGISELDISNQDGAAKAISMLKNAINYVSDVRGTLGATQNRLDHTINNLSVMTENIQDAESTIRDTDVAEEMMAYTKNNILIQSAQAMLAQANQVPQGVLQLLQ